MAIYDLKANLDLKQNLNIYATCKQLDNLNLILSVYDNSVQTNLSNYTVRLKAMKADKVPLIQEHTGISTSSNIVTIVADEQLTITSGKTLMELQFIDNSTGKKKATFNLVLNVVSSTLEIDRSISKATYTLLEELENKLDQASDFFENIDTATNINNELKDTINTANSKNNTLTETINNSNTTNDTLNNLNTVATQTKNDLENQNSQAVTNKTNLDSANSQAVLNYEALQQLGDATELAIKVEQNTTQLNDIAINFESFPRLSDETNDYNRFTRAYSSLNEGETLFFSNKTYDFGGNSITLDKNINLKGAKKPYYDLTNKTFIEGTGTIFKNVKIIFHGKGYTVENIANQSETIDNGFEGNTGDCSNVEIKNCACKCSSHAYLFESYNGDVNDIKISDSEAYDCTHGFISKAPDTQFINCYSANMSQYGFGFISDNIPSANKKGVASGGMAFNCKADNCLRGICMYSRDMYSEDNSNGIMLSKVKLISFKAKNCTTGFMFGDGLVTTTGVTYNPIYDIECYGCSSEHTDNSEVSLEIKKVNRLTFEGYIDGVINHNGLFVRDVNLKIQSPLGNKNKLVDNIVINDNTQYPSLELKNMYENTVKFQNTATTIVKGLLGGNFNSGDILTLLIDDDFTYLSNADTSSNMVFKKALYTNKGTWVKLKYDGSKWNEIEHYENGATMQQIDIATTNEITNEYVNNLDCLLNSNTTNKIILPSPTETDYKEYTLYIRGNDSSADVTYGGLDTANLVNNDSVKTTFANGEMQVINIIKSPFISKWIIKSVSNSKVF